MQSKEQIKALSKEWGIDPQVLNVLCNNVHGDKAPETIKLFIDYCQKSLGLTENQLIGNFAHIYTSRGKNVTLPAIGYYRLRAIESGCYAGISEPEFGPLITIDAGGKKISYPEWCKITVRKIVHGHICEFVAKEYWIENCATVGLDVPNYMWSKRSYGQLAKCTEAQALRKAFELDQNPSFEEMEGKEFFNARGSEELVLVKEEQKALATPKLSIEEKVEQIAAKTEIKEADDVIANNLNQDIITRLKELIAENNVKDSTIATALARDGASKIEDMQESNILTWINLLETKLKKAG